ncbi:pyrroline-5-carboxylate reductase dimerization-domain-containing protein [Aspergillus pseudonomiae]|uniref:Pyrroline-5-carboxylate reductase dimerization-domain-containing protein n=1 Tax=Aspergillus pseudonomiae TaxID=1506151 RepID=A0A5N7DDB4_9EURO|nr:pyrroline-5-carboxylate reductase dimerization-domain-containing protein [Aspergillus pseudonomiae]KAB8266295.1 pyrroline-5-carboxylate reductase dimerization-domain-containing protein [Aspergillus pseudonomiae]KAE8404450.1 pyrroline-5-carboxylate reductase dimerization-domain-containing protein [Aspergillus pseudonomiae]
MTISTESPSHLTFVGGGHLAQAIISGILSSTSPWTLQCDIAVTARRLEHVQELRSRYQQLLVTDNNLDQRIWQAARISQRSSTQDTPTSPIVFICTRPADVPTVAKQLAPTLASFDPLVRPTVVTMCPGITVSQLQDWLPTGTAIVRSMPNTPVEFRQGATGLFASEDATLRVNHVKTVLEEVSPLVTIVPEESMLDVVAAVSGSGPAHFFFVIESMVAAAESMGLSREVAEPLVIQSCLGAGYLARASSKPVATLRKEVCVPGGSTEKAISHLDQSGVQELFKVAIQKSLNANLKMRFC